MEYSIKPDLKNSIIQVKVSGVLSQEKRKEMLKEIQKNLENCNLSKVLVDLIETKFAPAEPGSGAFELISYMKAIGIKPEMKFALIYSGNDYQRALFQRFANMEGFNLRYFKDLNEAVDWLE